MNKTIKLPLFLLMAVVLALTFAFNASATTDHNLVKEVIVNDVKVVDNYTLTDEHFVVETGDTLFVTVKLKSATDVDDVSIEAEIRGLETGTLRQETGLFDMKANKTYAKFLTIKIPEDIDLKRKLTRDLTLRITASNDEEDRQDIDFTVDRERHNLFVLDVQAPSEVDAGNTLLVETAVRNRGYEYEEDVFVKASIPELGISKQKYLGDFVPYKYINRDYDDDTDKAVAFIRLEIPEDAKTGDYTLKVTAYTHDGVAKTEKTSNIRVNGIQLPQTSIVADATTKSVAREQGVVYKITVTNLGETQTYTAELTGVDFGTSSVNPAILTLTHGANGEFNVFVSPAKTATLGSHAFNVVVKANGETVKTLNLNTEVTGQTTDKLRQNLIVIAIILVVILIILAIIIAVVTGRRPEQEEKLY